MFSVALAQGQKTKTTKKTTASNSTAGCCMSGSKTDKASDMKDCSQMKDCKTAGKGCCSMQKSGKMSSSKSTGKMDCCAQHKNGEAKADTKSGKSDKAATEGEKN
jgi:hypothetical protein